MINFKNRYSGFTLIELLLVIAIVGILASAVLVNVGSARLRARDANRKKLMNSLRVIFDMYYMDHGYYPGGYDDPGCTECANGYLDGTPDPDLAAALAPYLGGSSLPADPINSGGQRIYYDARHVCGGHSNRAHIYIPALEDGSGNVSSMCTSWGSEGMGGLGSGDTWTVELYK